MRTSFQYEPTTVKVSIEVRRMYIKFIISSFLLCCWFNYNVKAQLHIPCVTPNNENATCESIYDCKIFLDVIKNQKESQDEFMRKSLCGRYRDVPVVCCGSKNDYNPGNRPKRQASSSDSCGISVKGDPKSINTIWREFPWSARIQYNKSNVFACEGTLINSQYVLTAGLCIDQKTLKRAGNVMKVRLGQHNCMDLKDCKEEYVDFGAAELITHKDYGLEGHINHDDIGLIKLDKEVTFSDAIRPVCLPKPEDTLLQLGEAVTEIGWYRNSKQKLKTEIPVASLEVCSKVYNELGVTLTKTHLCAGGLANGTCAGASGGSLVKEKDEKWYLEGIISFGPAVCGKSGVPNVYTNIRPYLEWIKTTAKL